MAGHSQFKNIMVRKGKQDAKRAKVFTKVTREIISAAKSGMPDPAANPRLRAAIQWAREENMPRDRIDGAIKRASAAGEADNYETIRYEGYGPGGVAVIVQALTDNRNRTAPDLRSTFVKNNGTLGESGSVSFMFEHAGVIIYPASAASDDAMFEAAIDAGADNVESDGESHTVTTSIEAFIGAREALDSKFKTALSAKLAWVPKMTTAVSEEVGQQVLKLIDALEDNDDVQEVYTNVELPQSLIDKLNA
jgi:YebC/PmpR family DNA-binding regulatory protein